LLLKVILHQEMVPSQANVLSFKPYRARDGTEELLGYGVYTDFKNSQDTRCCMSLIDTNACTYPKGSELLRVTRHI